MYIFKIVPVAVILLALTWRTGADKKIELQDIEEDNLKSEKEKDHDIPEQRSQNGAGTARDMLPLEFLKNGILRYFERPQVPQQPRYVHQYAVNEPPEKVAITPKPHYGPPATQQAMVGYLSNVPMQIYFVPQYYGDPNEQSSNPQPGVQYASPAAARVAAYPTSPEVVQQANYIDIPSYVTPTGKAYADSQYTPQIAFVTFAPQPTSAPANNHVSIVAASGSGVTGPQASGPPVLAYSMPLIHYPTSLISPNYKTYYNTYAQHTDANTVDDTQETEVENPRHYATQTEVPYTKTTSPEFPRYYTSRAPLREEQRHHPVPELPHPSPLLLRSQAPHLTGIPKALPMFRPITKPVYSAPGNLIHNVLTPRPVDMYGYGFSKKRPTSLLDSYIPSSVQLEYLKRGYSKDPLTIYDALSTGRASFSHPTSRHYERGFLPNQMYHTASGGITYGHYKRTPKSDKAIQN